MHVNERRRAEYKAAYGILHVCIHICMYVRATTTCSLFLQRFLLDTKTTGIHLACYTDPLSFATRCFFGELVNTLVSFLP